jgi:hypothetical protein
VGLAEGDNLAKGGFADHRKHPSVTLTLGGKCGLGAADQNSAASTPSPLPRSSGLLHVSIPAAALGLG